MSTHVVIVGSLMGGITAVYGPLEYDPAHDLAEKLHDEGEDDGIHVVELSEPPS